MSEVLKVVCYKLHAMLQGYMKYAMSKVSKEIKKNKID